MVSEDHESFKANIQDDGRSGDQSPTQRQKMKGKNS